jgi:hypothetical protein
MAFMRVPKRVINWISQITFDSNQKVEIAEEIVSAPAREIEKLVYKRTVTNPGALND